MYIEIDREKDRGLVRDSYEFVVTVDSYGNERGINIKLVRFVRWVKPSRRHRNMTAEAVWGRNYLGDHPGGIKLTDKPRVPEDVANELHQKIRGLTRYEI